MQDLIKFHVLLNEFMIGSIKNAKNKQILELVNEDLVELMQMKTEIDIIRCNIVMHYIVKSNVFGL